MVRIADLVGQGHRRLEIGARAPVADRKPREGGAGPHPRSKRSVRELGCRPHHHSLVDASEPAQRDETENIRDIAVRKTKVECRSHALGDIECRDKRIDESNHAAILIGNGADPLVGAHSLGQ